METKKSLLASWYLSRMSDTDMFFDEDEVEVEDGFRVEFEEAAGAVDEDDRDED